MLLLKIVFTCIVIFWGFIISPLSAKTYTADEFEQVRQQLRQTFANSPKEALKLVNSYLSDPELLTEQQLICLNYKSWFLIETDQLKEATQTLVQYQSLADKFGLPVFKYGYHNMYAGLYTRIENYEAALEHHLKAQALTDTLKPQLAHQTNNNIAMLYTNVGRYEEAIEMFEQYIAYLKQGDRPLSLSLVLVNLAETQADIGDFKKARETINEAMAIQKKHDYKRYLASSHFILGMIEREEKNFDQSINYLEHAIKEFNELSIAEEATQAQISLAKTYLETGDNDKIDSLITSALLNAEQHHLPALQSQIHKFAANVYEQRHDLPQALMHFKTYQELHDQLLLQRADINLAKAIAESDVTSKELEILELTKSKQLKLEKAKLFQYIALTIICGLIIFITGAIFALRSINKSNLRLRRSLNELAATQNKLIETEKVASLTSLSSGMAHQLNTPIGTIVTANSLINEKLVNLEQQFENKTLSQSALRQFINIAKDTKEIVNKSTQRLTTMVEQFKALKVSLDSTQKVSTFSLHELVVECTTKFNSYLGKEVKFTIDTNNIEICSIYPVLADVFVNLITNSFEHGFKHQDSGTICINSELNDDKITITFEDDGAGIKPELLKEIFTPFFSTNLGGNHLGLGLNVVFNAVKHQLHGDITALPYERGACFVITLPKSFEQS
ncbi:tetratricopeptide repeat-containing sensor histidine kinase [Thalassotalea marina]|uniref:histidine kinase n=1 Tax=Thalassotalea marina TaxID=1673741 RepID=A0A919ENV1_9GAMM|nr:tetratricopeptide repeat-containing sensor histidine kinase [Thalassotalea marina]GHG06098.1 hypothetical protein GCM10017161_39640 [Thalassotalea marina]